MTVPESDMILLDDNVYIEYIVAILRQIRI